MKNVDAPEAPITWTPANRPGAVTLRMTMSRAGSSLAVPTATMSHGGSSTDLARVQDRVASPPPAPAGWSGAAMAVNAVRQIERPVLVALGLPDHEPIWIDLRSNTYVWDAALESLPLNPEIVQLRTRAIEPSDPGLEGSAQSLDPLLWTIGLNAFPGRATWLRAGDRYRLKGRPDFTALAMSEGEVTLVKSLARGFTTVDKLAERCGQPDSRAQRVVNALSLMDMLRRLEAADAAPPLPPMSLGA